MDEELMELDFSLAETGLNLPDRFGDGDLTMYSSVMDALGSDCCGHSESDSGQDDGYDADTDPDDQELRSEGEEANIGAAQAVSFLAPPAKCHVTSVDYGVDDASSSTQADHSPPDLAGRTLAIASTHSNYSSNQLPHPGAVEEEIHLCTGSSLAEVHSSSPEEASSQSLQVSLRTSNGVVDPPSNSPPFQKVLELFMRDHIQSQLSFVRNITRMRHVEPLGMLDAQKAVDRFVPWESFDVLSSDIV
ncbi:hypothetical protein C8Q80DRAFT_1272879 [Daedaleopsis nitida]|nr:hypothetical protein C8Q80DRAFT_1272879 [Daedaleopsis nitida]